MSEGLQEQNVQAPDLETEPLVKLTTPLAVLTGRGWLRIAYTLEFFIAILVVLTLWSEVGGQGHLDLIPWYVKLICVLGSAWCCVRFTAGMAEESAAWNRRTIGWLSGLILFAIVMGGITYYYHLHEDSDDDPDDTSSTVKVMPGSSYYYASDRTWR